jgi:hypothetical protein
VNYLAIALATIVFFVCFRLCGIVAASARAIEISRRAAAVMREPATSEEEKERAIRGFSIQLFALFASITVRGLVLVAAPVLLVAAFSCVGLARFDEVVDLLVSWQTILLTSVAFVFFMWLTAR